MSSDEVRDLLDDDLTGFTTATITAMERLEEELELVRVRGYAVAEGELRDDIASIAAPILGRQGRPLGSISVFLPIHRLPATGVERLGACARSAADAISEQFRN